MEYYLAQKCIEISGKWMQLEENCECGNVTHIQGKHCMYSFIVVISYKVRGNQATIYRPRKTM